MNHTTSHVSPNSKLQFHGTAPSYEKEVFLANNLKSACPPLGHSYFTVHEVRDEEIQMQSIEKNAS